ncbi:helix-turn-helix domain-containing protein [Streptomyces sp. st115]|uniref:winged helix-turn-helix transcriptional regulator n=1 Tax=Streptomyces sp. st115 TaxID=1828047 RepID=UPI00211D5094|nr:winged helix-turn-helix transcriptional regulator [Streptomyces sp. st115]
MTPQGGQPARRHLSGDRRRKAGAGTGRTSCSDLDRPVADESCIEHEPVAEARREERDDAGDFARGGDGACFASEVVTFYRVYQERPVRHEYVLTDFGRSLRPILVAMAAWRNEQLAPSERAMVLVDTDTGREVEPVTVDPVTGLSVSDPRFAFRSGPAAGEQMRARYADRGRPA